MRPTISKIKVRRILQPGSSVFLLSVSTNERDEWEERKTKEAALEDSQVRRHTDRHTHTHIMSSPTPELEIAVGVVVDDELLSVNTEVRVMEEDEDSCLL